MNPGDRIERITLLERAASDGLSKAGIYHYIGSRGVSPQAAVDFYAARAA